MSRGKKKHTDRPVEWKISIPESIAAPVELLLLDPVSGKPKHGARAKLITQLLSKWLEERKANK